MGGRGRGSCATEGLEIEFRGSLEGRGGGRRVALFLISSEIFW